MSLVGALRAVGPVLQAGPASEAVVLAIREANPDVLVLDRGSYLRVSAPGQCIVTREAVERFLGHEFRFPSDLEMIMPSFSGAFSVDERGARWTA
jgi:toluene monooxygenase system protein D